ncbi:methyltransferase [Phytohabitans houttuyneae]|uniref:Hydroxyneurosporene-O-methyltransferase n=1 Tax=Phytohabitans houttuyneae TaxID=1076126 RepID=A0A6V8KG63_9ACTN|nr:methyltransferase [Phytohabitans houttuyneae]GFJ81378.1 hydroxyneurosporene-O-methyltransferase [Phytohabitans houttuyneae]
MAGDRDYHRKRLLGMLRATWVAQACSVFTILGLPDRIAAGETTAVELAAAANVDPVALRRLLGALAEAGILREVTTDRYELSPVGEYLRSDVPGSARSTAVLYGQEVYRSFDGLLETVRTGRPSFGDVFGLPFYEYLDRNPDFATTFNTAMATAPVSRALTADLLGGAHTIVDVGGGDGGLLAEVLRDDPDRRGVLAELPEAAAQARERLAEAGVLDRVRIVPGSFFDEVPGSGDLYLLCRVLHNWNDANAGRVLERVRVAMPATARLVVLEELLPTTAQPRSASAGAWAAPRTRIVDLLMLVLMEGRDRTAEEYTKLLADNGFAVKSVTEDAIEAVPA